MIALAIRYWYILALAAMAAFIGAQQLRISHAHTQLANYKLEVSNAARIASELARKESDRKQKAFDDEAAAARVEKANLEADVVRLADAADGVRDQLAAFQSSAKSCPKAAIGSKSEPSSDPIGVLAGLLSRADREAASLATYSDRLRVAGLACERASDKIASD